MEVLWTSVVMKRHEAKAIVQNQSVRCGLSFAMMGHQGKSRSNGMRIFKEQAKIKTYKK
jgi:hypothetical protein